MTICNYSIERKLNPNKSRANVRHEIIEPFYIHVKQTSIALILNNLGVGAVDFIRKNSGKMVDVRSICGVKFSKTIVPRRFFVRVPLIEDLVTCIRISEIIRKQVAGKKLTLGEASTLRMKGDRFKLYERRIV